MVKLVGALGSLFHALTPVEQAVLEFQEEEKGMGGKGQSCHERMITGRVCAMHAGSALSHSRLFFPP